MAVSNSLRAELFQSSDWAASLRSRCEALRASRPDTSRAGEAVELGELSELCDPDRSQAIAAYLWAWKSDRRRVELLSRARNLCREIGDLSTTAKLLHLEASATGDPRMLYAEGVTWLDAGEPDRAVKPLLAAARSFPGDERVAQALETARREWPDVRRELERLLAEAESAGDRRLAARHLLTAARILGMLETDTDLYEQYLLAAFARWPRDTSVFGLVEQALTRKSDPEKLLEVYSLRLRAFADDDQRIEEHRRIGTRLAQSPRWRGAGMRLLQGGLELAYQSGTSSIPGHVSSLRLLAEHALEASLASSFLGLTDRALALPLPEHELLFIALTAIEVARSHPDTSAAVQVYAAIVARLAPGHPVLEDVSFSGTASDGGDASLYLDELEAAALPLDLGEATVLPFDVGDDALPPLDLGDGDDALPPLDLGDRDDALPPLDLGDRDDALPRLDLGDGDAALPPIEPAAPPPAPTAVSREQAPPTPPAPPTAVPHQAPPVDDGVVVPLRDENARPEDEAMLLDDDDVLLLEDDDALLLDDDDLDDDDEPLIEVEAPEPIAATDDDEVAATDDDAVAATDDDAVVATDDEAPAAAEPVEEDTAAATPATPAIATRPAPAPPAIAAVDDGWDDAPIAEALPPRAAPAARPLPDPTKAIDERPDDLSLPPPTAAPLASFSLPAPPTKAPPQQAASAESAPDPRRRTAPLPETLLPPGEDRSTTARQTLAKKPPATKKAIAKPAAAKPAAAKPTAIGSLIPRNALAALSSISTQRSDEIARKQASGTSRKTRSAIPIDLEIHAGGDRHPAVTRDVSESGAFLLVADLALEIGSEIELHFAWPGDAGIERASCQARVARRDATGVGVSFRNPTSDFLERLRAFIERET